MTADRSPPPKPLRELPSLLVRFLRNPLEAMRSSITMTWPAVFLLQIVSAMISGALTGLLSRNIWDALIGALIFPITSLLAAQVFALFLSYFFSLFQAIFLDYRRLYSIVVLSTVPYFFFHAFSGFLPPMDLIGFTLSGLLLIVGLVEQFGLDKRVVIRVVGGIGAAFFVVWSAVQITTDQSRDSEIPRDLDRLEREVKGE